MTVAEVVSNIIALVAIVISLYGLIREHNVEKRAHEFDIFRDVYQEFLVKRLPEARSQVSITRAGSVSGIDNFVAELVSLRKASIYFQYAEPQFYEDLRSKLWDLEDYLVMLPIPFTGEPRVNFDHEVNAKLKAVYQCLLKKF